MVVVSFIKFFSNGCKDFLDLLHDVPLNKLKGKFKKLRNMTFFSKIQITVFDLSY